jgi:hypothetical protein
MPSEEMILKIKEQCANELSSYAIPRFLRFRQTLDITSTFKQQKMTLKQEAFNVDVIQDPLYKYNDQMKTQNTTPVHLEQFQNPLEKS